MNKKGILGKTITVAILAMMLGLGLFGQIASAEFGSATSRSFGTTYGPATTDLIIVGTATSTGTLTESGYIEGKTGSSSPPTTVVAREETTAALIVGLSLTNQMSITFAVKKGDYWRVDSTATTNYLYEYQVNDNSGDPLTCKITPDKASLGQTVSLDIQLRYPNNNTGIEGRAGYVSIDIYSSNGTKMLSAAHPTEIDYGLYYYNYILSAPRDGAWRVVILHNYSGTIYATSCSFIDPVLSVEEMFSQSLDAFTNQSKWDSAAQNRTADAMNNISDAIGAITIPNSSAAIQATADAITGQTFAYDNPNFDYTNPLWQLAGLDNKTFAYDIEEALWAIANITTGGSGGGISIGGCYPTRDFTQEVITVKPYIQVSNNVNKSFSIEYRRPIYANYTASFAWWCEEDKNPYVSNISLYELDYSTLAETYLDGWNLTNDFCSFGVPITEPGYFMIKFTITSDGYTTTKKIPINVRDDAEIRCIGGNATNEIAEAIESSSVQNRNNMETIIGMLLLAILPIFIIFWIPTREEPHPIYVVMLVFAAMMLGTDAYLFIAMVQSATIFRVSGGMFFAMLSIFAGGEAFLTANELAMGALLEIFKKKR